MLIMEPTKLLRQAAFITGATKKTEFPVSDLPEVAFIGRSNVGKSSLINAITDNSKLARVSKSPGCTRQINFFQIVPYLMLVDLPGYGYAKASNTDVTKWIKCMIDYLRERRQLRKIFLLIDSRIGIGKYDLEMIELLANFGTACQIVLTKFDKLSVADRERVVQDTLNIAANYTILIQNILTSSSRNKQVDDLRQCIIDTVL